MIKVVLLACIVAIECIEQQDRVHFPEAENPRLPRPAPCENDAIICGGNEDDYPSVAITRLVENSVVLANSQETQAKFFEDPAVITTRNAASTVEELRACSSRTETMPRFARAQNIGGIWKYLIQKSDGQVQQAEITVCNNPNRECINGLDSPDGPQSLKCRQLHRNQKLLAVNASGVVEVDTFQLPSACVCNHKVSSILTRAQLPKDTQRNGLGVNSNEECNTVSDTLDISVPYILQKPPRMIIMRTPVQRRMAKIARTQVTQSRLFPPSALPVTSGFQRRQAGDFSFGPVEKLVPEPCPNGTILCEGDDRAYPNAIIQRSVDGNTLLRYEGFFEKVFNGACESLPDDDSFIETRSFDLTEDPICHSHQRYIFPQRAQTTNGGMVFVVNTKEYQQGVTVAECLSHIEGVSCTYGGQLGNFPEATLCKQLYSKHKMLALSPENEIYVETFKIPSACACHILDETLFF